MWQLPGSVRHKTASPSLDIQCFSQEKGGITQKWNCLRNIIRTAEKGAETPFRLSGR